MSKVTEHQLHSANLVVHSLLILVGLIVIGLGIILLKRPQMQLTPGEDIGDEIFELCITVGCMDIGIGVCGLAAALMKQRALRVANATLLAFALVLNLLFFVLCIVEAIVNKDKTAAVESYKAMFAAEYGNLTDPETRRYTSSVDVFQELKSCCGWTGLDGENLFTKTPWYKLVNQNVTGTPKTLPDSCCIRPGDVDCHTAQNVKKAREKGLVYRQDCMDATLDGIKDPLHGLIFQIVLSMAFQIQSAVLTVTLLMPTSAASGTEK